VFGLFSDIRVEFIGGGDEEEFGEKILNGISFRTTFGFGGVGVGANGSAMEN